MTTSSFFGISMPHRLSFFIAFFSLFSFHVSTEADENKPKKNKKAQSTAQERTLGIVLFPSFEFLDAAGPIEVWGNLPGKIKLVTVAAAKGPVASSQGPKLMADYGWDDCPGLELVLVPGGFGVREAINDASLIAWLKNRSAKAELTMSVCNGASILATAGLLDGRPATTNKAFWEMATAPGPKVKWIHQARWVDDGNIVTSSGVSAGIDMSLHVVERLFGEKKAQGIADQIEHEWHRDSTRDPFAERHPLKSR